MPLIKLQKRIVRIMEGCDYRNHTEPIFQEIKLLTLNGIYFLKTVKFMHRIHCKQNNITSNFYKTAASIHHHYTRYSEKNNYYVQPSNLSLGRKAINNWSCNLGPNSPIPEKIFTKNIRKKTKELLNLKKATLVKCTGKRNDYANSIKSLYILIFGVTVVRLW